MGRDIAGAHHEKWDGSGYPNALAGESIPLSARIVALVDVYDALTSPRCYKRPFSHEEAMTLILEGKGKHFDPKLVDSFMVISEQFAVLSKASLLEED
ncbi:HD-GYP domain-containing protein [Shewanella frigidimarina]|uniref:HD-GYP domain-containing protein n=2 Tax=Shewanella TaxID=22 RepID=UPI003D7C0F83